MVERLSKERPGILHRWAKAFKELHDRKEFLIPETSKLEVAVYLLENDPIALWLEERVIRSSNKTLNSDLYADFRFWATAAGYSQKDIPTLSQWGRRLTTLNFPNETLTGAGEMRGRARRLQFRPGVQGHV